MVIGAGVFLGTRARVESGASALERRTMTELVAEAASCVGPLTRQPPRVWLSSPRQRVQLTYQP